MSDWTPTEQTIETKYGPIRYGGPCKDDYLNMRVYDQGGGKEIVVLQGPAMHSFKSAQIRYARKSGWSKERIDKNPEGRAILILPGSKRTCATQTILYEKDPHRYADPKITGHTRGLAIDVSQNQKPDDLENIKEALRQEGWKQTRPDDEPWHYSYHVTI